MAISLHGLALRFVTACLLGPVTLLILFYGGWPFYLFVTAAFIIAALEWRGIALELDRPAVMLGLGYLYLALCFFSFVTIRFAFMDGAWASLGLLIAVWASDSGAYFIGKTLRGPKLAARISPNKTWTGLGGAMFFCGTALASSWCGFEHFATGIPPIALIFIFIIGCLLGIVGQAGDLLISIFKRRADIKDTGYLIPGHGGLLDRIDALLLVSPVFLLVLWLWQK